MVVGPAAARANPGFHSLIQVRVLEAGVGHVCKTSDPQLRRTPLLCDVFERQSRRMRQLLLPGELIHQGDVSFIKLVLNAAQSYETGIEHRRKSQCRGGELLKNGEPSSSCSVRGLRDVRKGSRGIFRLFRIEAYVVHRVRNKCVVVRADVLPTNCSSKTRQGSFSFDFSMQLALSAKPRGNKIGFVCRRRRVGIVIIIFATSARSSAMRRRCGALRDPPLLS